MGFEFKISYILFKLFTIRLLLMAYTLLYLGSKLTLNLTICTKLQLHFYTKP